MFAANCNLLVETGPAMLACQEICIKVKLKLTMHFINKVFPKSKHTEAVIYLLDKHKFESIKKRLKMISLE